MYHAEDRIGRGQETHDLSVITFVDDLLKVHDILDHTASSAIHHINSSNDVLDTCLSRSLSKKSFMIHPADLMTIDPIAKTRNK